MAVTWFEAPLLGGFDAHRTQTHVEAFLHTAMHTKLKVGPDLTSVQSHPVHEGGVQAGATPVQCLH